MNTYVADTHALLWHLSDNPVLGLMARKVFDEAETGNATILISAITLIETIYLAEKKKIPSEILQSLLDKIGNSVNYVVIPITLEIAISIQKIKRENVPDMPDRIISATAKNVNCKLITKDEKIRKCNVVETIW